MPLSQADVLPFPRAIYRASLLLAVLALGVSVPLELGSEQPFFFNVYFLPVAALLLAVQAFWPAPGTRVGYRQVILSYTTVAIVFLIELVASLYGYLNADRYAGDLSEVTVWAPVLYLAAYVTFRPRLATLLAVVQLVLTVAASVLFVMLDMQNDNINLPLNTLSDLVLASATVILLLYVFRHMAENFILAQATAENQTRLANTDHLTGLLNRRALYDVLEQALAHAKAFRSPLTVILFDLDHFKKINDSHGHVTGDQVLVAVADFLRGHLGRGQSLGRWGGEEFLIVMEGTPQEAAHQFAERLNRGLARTRLAPDGPITASFGVAETESGDNISMLLQRADKALYQAKRDGRGLVRSAHNTRTPSPSTMLPIE
ncbi:MAG TPA: GGDEF domain-containing protein [Trueperaceae bacterium]